MTAHQVQHNVMSTGSEHAQEHGNNEEHIARPAVLVVSRSSTSSSTSTPPSLGGTGDDDQVQASSSSLPATPPTKTATLATPPSSSRPSLLAISSARGKASSTSSTSVTTIPRIQRATSSTHRSHVQTEGRPPRPLPTSSRSSYKGKERQSPASSSVPASPAPRGPIHVRDYAGATAGQVEEPEHAHSIGQNELELDNDGFHPSTTPAETTSTNITSLARTFPSAADLALNPWNDDSISVRNDDNDEDDDDNDDGELVSWPLEGESDPRVMLREQLRRTESARFFSPTRTSRSRTQSYQSGRTASSKRSSLAPETLASSMLATDTAASHAHAVQSSSSVRDDGDGESRLANQHMPFEQKRSRPRRYFVLTSAGKPVFASQPNWRKQRKSKAEKEGKTDPEADWKDEDEQDSEEMLTSLVGVIQAIISLYAVENDMIRYIDAGNLRIAFYLKAPIYLVAVSNLGEPESVLRQHLEYLYLAIISITTQSSISSIFKQRSNYDLRRLLAGTDNILNGLLESLQEGSLTNADATFEVVGQALKVVPFLANNATAHDKNVKGFAELNNIENLREDCTKALRPPKKLNDILYAILVSHTSLITLLRPKDHSIYPSDLHILLNTLSATKALRASNSESWIPICLPRFNSKGFLHAFISYFDESAAPASTEGANDSQKTHADEEQLGLGLILITADKEGFFDMKIWKDHVVSKLFHHSASGGSALSAFSQPQVSLYARLKHAIVPAGQSPSIPALRDDASSLDSAAEKLSSSAQLSSPQPNIPPIRHFWYKSKTYVQVFVPYVAEAYTSSESDNTTQRSSFTGNYAESAVDRQRLMSQYLHVHEALHSTSNRARGDGSAKLVYIVNEHEAVLGLATTHYEVYICLPPLVPKKTAADAAHALARWVRKNERKIFLTSAPSF